MLPLKLASSSESAALEENPDPQDSGAGQVDDSVTSNSSVLNADASVEVADENSCSTRLPAAFEFSILRGSASVEGENEAEEEDGSEVRQQPVLVTWQLFPPAPAVPDVSRQPMAVSSSSSSWPPHWLDFTFCQAEAPSEPGVAHQQPLLQKRRQPPQQAKKSRRGPQSRSSEYRGVTFYRRTGRWESHIWDCGKQLYLGGFDTAHAAARAYDRAAIKFRGFHADINFKLSDYEEDLEQTKNLSKEEFVHLLRRQSTGFSRGSSKYKSLTLPTCHRWEAPMEQIHGKNRAYDKAPIKCNGREAVTNSEPSTFEGDMFSGGDTEGHNLDLNLRISQPVVPKWNQNLLGGQFVDSDADKTKREIQNRPEVGLLQAPSVWNWPTNSQSPFPPLSSAASSGFSTTKMMAAVSSLQSSAPSVTHHLHFSPQATPNHYFRN